MSSVIYNLEKMLTPNQLYDLAKSLHDSYEPLMQDYRAWKIIDTLAPESARTFLTAFRKEIVGHKIINDIIMNYYPCEKVVKYYLTKKYLYRKRDITLFEMKINTSRLDFGRINGNSYGYEIKTELDQLTKLERQINDYSKVLEYVYVVIHPNHFSKVKEIIPDFCGIYTYNEKFIFSEQKKASKSPNINSGAQVSNLSSKDIEFILRSIKVKEIPTTRKEREKILFNNLSDVDINKMFKLALKNKFKERWEYLKRIFNEIQPIDTQVFFSTPAEPFWVYYKNSSIV